MHGKAGGKMTWQVADVNMMTCQLAVTEHSNYNCWYSAIIRTTAMPHSHMMW